ncbi:DUF3800 domain-containing protein [Kribbella sp. NPDC055071]
MTPTLRFTATIGTPCDHGHVFLAYVDETGDPGPISKDGASLCYALGCLIIPIADWPRAFDEIIEFRRRVRDRFGIPMRAELKANYLIRNGGPLRQLKLAPAERSLIYRAHLRMIHSIGGRGFAVVIDKRGSEAPAPEIFHTAWETLLQRLERTSHYEKAPFMLIHDDGENDLVRAEVRKARRHMTAGRMHGGGTFRLPAKALIEDPVPRASQHSYFIQTADLLAYAGWRSYLPPSKAVAIVAPSAMWQELGQATHSAVNKYSGGIPGVVVRNGKAPRP